MIDASNANPYLTTRASHKRLIVAKGDAWIAPGSGWVKGGK
jgi:hypothetical protein